MSWTSVFSAYIDLQLNSVDTKSDAPTILCLFVSTILNEGAYFTFKSLNDGIIAIWEKASVSLLISSAKQELYH